MEARGKLAFLACGLVLALALPAAASAKPGYEVRPGGVQMDLFLGLKKGYLFSVTASDRQRVQLAAEEVLESSAVYSTKGRVSSSRVEADFGSYGRIDVEIELASGRSQPDRKRSRRCKGRPPLLLSGTYRGIVEFSGEGHLPAISSKRGRLIFTHRYRQVCKRSSQQEQGGGKLPRVLEVGALRARAKGEGRTTVFEAINLASLVKPALSFGVAVGSVHERREGVRIARAAFELFGSGMRMSERGEKPETFRARMEAPFGGRGLYSKAPGSPPTWTGDLAVRLPGVVGPVPLTGPDFSTDFCRGFSLPEVVPCLYGSGSHSQPLALARLSSLR